MKRALACLTLLSPLAAQSFGDGPAFGGSVAFSEGLSLRGNPARYDQAQPGWYLSWEGGDDKARDAKEASDRFALAPSAETLRALSDHPYAERRQAYGLALASQGGLYLAFGRDFTTGVRVLGDATTPTASQMEVGRMARTRMVMGAGSMTDGQAYGFSFGVERLETGRLLRPLEATTPAGSGLAYEGTTRTNTALTLGFGAQFTLVQALKLAVAGDRLLPRTFNGVRERPQFRAGLSLDLGPTTALVVESDVNTAQRLPLPVDQRTAAASLRMTFSPALSGKVGAERRTVDGQATTLVGAALTLRSAPLHVTFGFQFGNDRPMKGLAVKVDG